jgi:hypothetical protein
MERVDVALCTTRVYALNYFLHFTNCVDYWRVIGKDVEDKSHDLF